MTVRLFDPGPADERSLTDRQRQGLAAIRAAGWDGLTSDDIGAIVHYPKHPVHETCSWCRTAGHEIGSALRARGLVKQRRRKDLHDVLFMVWVAVDAKPDQADRDYELPESF